MKIGFDLVSMRISITGPFSGTAERLKPLFSELTANGHELLAFFISDMDMGSARKSKKHFLDYCKKNRVPAFCLSVIAKGDLAGAAERNHVDILVTTEQVSVSGDCVCPDDLNLDALLKHIADIVKRNRTPVLAEDIVPDGLPSVERLWMKYYRVGDLKWNHENMSPYDRLVISNQDWLDETAIEFFGKAFTYEEFFRRIDETADTMYFEGIRKGMRVPLILVNTPESLMVLYALYRLKATIIPIFPLSTKEDLKIKLQTICEQNEADGFAETTLFLSDLVFDRFCEVVPERVRVITLDITASMPKTMSFVFRHIIAPKMGLKPVVFSERVVSFDKYIEKRAPHVEVDTSFDDTYTAVQLFTGGTVKPKGVMLTEASIDSASKQFYNDRFAFRRGDKIAAFMPLNHSFGLIIGTHVALAVFPICSLQSATISVSGMPIFHMSSTSSPAAL